MLLIVENYRGVHNRVINAIDTRAFSKLPREGKIKMKGRFFLPFHGWSSRVISRSAYGCAVRNEAIYTVQETCRAIGRRLSRKVMASVSNERDGIPALSFEKWSFIVPP